MKLVSYIKEGREQLGAIAGVAGAFFDQADAGLDRGGKLRGEALEYEFGQRLQVHRGLHHRP